MSGLRTLRIASVCRELPSPADPSNGVFVLRRLQAMARLASVETIQPVGYFPWLRPLPDWALGGSRTEGSLAIHPEPMFYIPRVLKSLDGGWLALSVGRALRKLQATAPIDVVDAHFGYPEGVGSLRAARRLGLPVFITLRGFEAEYLYKPLIGKQIRAALASADGCICVSHSLRELALAHGAAPDRTVVIHNAIDAETFRPGDRSESRARLGVSGDIPIVVSVGSLIPRKRHHVLIAAFAGILEKFPRARLVIIGGESFDSRYPPRLRRLVAELGIGDAVELRGNLAPARVADWLRAADLFALGTQREGCCNAVLEALASGLPVVTTPVGDNAYFIDEVDNGLLVPVDDTAATSAALMQVLERSWDRQRIADGLGVGGWDRAAAQVLEFFRTRLPDARGQGLPQRAPRISTWSNRER